VREHPECERLDLGPRVRGHDRNTDGAQAFGVVDVIAEVRGFGESHSDTLDVPGDEAELVLDPLGALGAKLASPRAHDRVLLHRHDQIPDADFVQSPETEPVATRESKRLLSALVHPDAVVGKDAVEVEDGQADAREKTPELVHPAIVQRRDSTSVTGCPR
jgi:hypothetical protein